MSPAPLVSGTTSLAYRDRLLPYGIVSAIFGYAGAELLLHVSNAQFSRGRAVADAVRGAAVHLRRRRPCRLTGKTRMSYASGQRKTMSRYS